MADAARSADLADLSKTGASAASAKAPRGGIVFAGLAYGAWGVIPLYWRLLDAVPPVEILAYRVVFSFLVIGAFLTLTRSTGDVVRALKTPRTALALGLSSLLIGANWGVFIAAIQLRRLSDASLGYFMNPLFSVLLGVLVLGEKLRRPAAIAAVLAGAALVVLLVLGGGIPWIAVVLATTFALYGLVRKRVAIGATAGLMVETLALLPFGIGYLVWLGPGGAHALTGTRSLLLAALSGPITAIPLVWFSRAARALPLSTLGLTQYLAPTLQFLVAVLVFGEAMPPLKWAAFSLIWVALAVFSIDLVRAALRPA